MFSTVVELTLFAKRNTPSVLAPSVILGVGGQLQETFACASAAWVQLDTCTWALVVLCTKPVLVTWRRDNKMRNARPHRRGMPIFQIKLAGDACLIFPRLLLLALISLAIACAWRRKHHAEQSIVDSSQQYHSQQSPCTIKLLTPGVAPPAVARRVERERVGNKRALGRAWFRKPSALATLAIDAALANNAISRSIL